MFGANTINTGLNLTKVLTGISKGLNIVNQVIPIYQQVKPMISNAKKVIGVLNEIKTPNNTKTTIENVEYKEKEITKKTELKQNQSNPVFFQ